MLGACSKQHSNNFGGVPPPCPPGDWNVLNTSSATCTNVFASSKVFVLTFSEHIDFEGLHNADCCLTCSTVK